MKILAVAFSRSIQHARRHFNNYCLFYPRAERSSKLDILIFETRVFGARERSLSRPRYRAHLTKRHGAGLRERRRYKSILNLPRFPHKNWLSRSLSLSRERDRPRYFRTIGRDLLPAAFELRAPFRRTFHVRLVDCVRALARSPDAL